MFEQRRYPYTSTLGWSISRYDTFSICKRQYYYHYYAKHDKELPPGKAAFLKSLTSVPLETGNLAHDTIAALLHRLRKSTSPINTDDVLKYSHNLVDKAVINKSFREVYYGHLESIDACNIKNRVSACLQNFFNSQWYEWLIGDAVIDRTNWIVEPKDFGEMRIGGLKAYCKVDFLFPTKERGFYILDWKTGKVNTEKHTRQMKGYMLYAMEIFDTTADQIKPVVVYLSDTYREFGNNFTHSDLDTFAEQIAFETAEMYQFCENVEEDIPNTKAFFFQQVGEHCSYCNYSELCGR